MNDASRPRLIYWVHIAVLLPMLVMSAYMFIDLALHPSVAEGVSPVGQLLPLLIGLVIAPLTVVVGLFCIRRSPGNVVGPILALWGCTTVAIVSNLETPWFLGISTLFSGVLWPALFFFFCYFPDGKVHPPRFQKWLDRIVLATYAAGIMLGLTTPVATANELPNPLYVSQLSSIAVIFQIVDFGGAIGAILFGLFSLTARFRKADPRTRQQIKWLFWGFMPIGLLAIAQLFIISLIPSLKALSDSLGPLIQLWLMIFPVIAVGNAILRHNLYDIDIIIRRTLIYSLLTAALAALYFGGVVLAQQVLRPFTESSDLAIVLSTLGIAALFNPLRRRIQRTIDRRFFRRKYNAERTLEAFSVATRDEVDLDKLQAALVGVVQETMQPTKISLWIKESK